MMRRDLGKGCTSRQVQGEVLWSARHGVLIHLHCTFELMANKASSIVQQAHQADVIGLTVISLLLQRAIHRTLLDIAGGMDYLHSVGVMHGDLKVTSD